MKYVLDRQPDIEVVGEAGTGREAVTQSARLRPDLVLMDVRMPDIDGLAATRAIKEQCPKTSVIIVTLYENPEYLTEALKAGAGGYLLKDATHKEILGAVRQVLRGETPLSSRLLAEALRRINPGAKADGASDQAHSLTVREREVLGLVVRGRTNKEIARELGITAGTAKSHVERIIRKLGVTDRTQAAVRAIALGLVILGNEAMP